MTPTHLINVGLAINNSETALTPENVLAVLIASGVTVVGNPLITVSDTEPTFVAVIAVPEGPDIPTLFWGISKRLQQEAVVIFDLHSHIGELYGPNAEAWGPFNPDYFTTPSGRRMSEEMPQNGLCSLLSDVCPELPAGTLGQIKRHDRVVATVDFGEAGIVTVAASEIKPLEINALEASS